jgi:hypothetical protein
MFALLGLRGQAIYVDPASKLVLVHTAVRRIPDPGVAELGAGAVALEVTYRCNVETGLRPMPISTTIGRTSCTVFRAW